MTNQASQSTIPETITAAQANESSLFFVADWKFEGAKITSIHGRDLSTEASYAEAPEGSIMVTVLQSNGVPKKLMVAPSVVFTR